MEFLDEYWEELIGLDSGKGVIPCNINNKYKSWNSDLELMGMLSKAIILLLPEKIIELGTFAGIGTEIMARCAGRYDKQSYLYTIDAGIPLNWDGKNKKLNVIELSDIEKKEWSSIIENRNRVLDKEFPFCLIEYHEGISLDVLPKILPGIGIWDLCFQDSSHLAELIIMEFKLLEPFARIGSIIVFDDIPTFDNCFIGEFERCTKDWNYRWTEKGHGQVWAEKVK